MRVVVVAVMLAFVLLVPPAAAQAEEALPFVEGPNKVYCHTPADSLTAWMNTLEDDGPAAPYYLYGASTSTTGVAIRPVANQAFTAVIPLKPGLTQTIVLDGTIKVQAYIGGGTYTAGSGSIGTSLRVDGQAVASAAAKSHTMTPATSSTQTYNAISWTMPISALTIEPTSTLEWVISGTASGNNLYLACSPTRGRSHIELPVLSASAPPGLVEIDPFDTDGDGLNDTWETTFFGGLEQNGTADPDADGLNNTAEQLAGTDPTNPDTDGDGVLDGEDPAPLDASIPAPPVADNVTAEPVQEANVTDDGPKLGDKESPFVALAPAVVLLAAALRRRQR